MYMPTGEVLLTAFVAVYMPPPYMLTCIIHACMHTYIQACIQAYIHTVYVYTPTCRLDRCFQRNCCLIHTYCIPPYIHTYIHIYIHTGVVLFNVIVATLLEAFLASILESERGERVQGCSHTHTLTHTHTHTHTLSLPLTHSFTHSLTH